MARRWLLIAGKYLALTAFVVWSIVPLLVIVSGSLKQNRDIFAFPPRYLFQPTVDNYVSLFREWPSFLVSLQNSLIVAAGATALTVVICLLGGYAYSRYSGRALSMTLFFLLFIRMLPPIVITVPLFPTVNALALNDTHLILILLYTAFYVSLGTLIMRTFVDQIPRELDEAAKIDGAGAMQIITTIVAPLAAPGLVAVGIFVFIFAWNEFVFAFIFASTKARTGPLMISEMLGAIDGIRWGVLFAAVTLQILPVVLFVAFFQRYIISGLTAGSVKG
jgi:multiple sugar transport system permease protein